MNMRSPQSLQGRVLALVMTLVISVWLATTLLTWLDARHELDELLDGHLAQAAALLVVQQARAIENAGDSVEAPTLHHYAPTVAFQIFHEGRLTLRSANAPLLPMHAAGSSFVPGIATLDLAGSSWRVFAAEGAEQDVQVYVGEQGRSRAEILWAVLRSALWPMLLALPILSLAVWWAVRRGVAPLHRLGQTLASRQPQALQPIAFEGISLEMLPMVSALNSLFVRIAALLEAERRFTADAAHELRTPIAAIRMQAQVALGESDDALRRHALLGTIEGCDRATRLVEQLLILARLESNSAQAFTPVDLGRLARHIVAELAPRAAARSQILECAVEQECHVAGNEILLVVLLRNLVDNAMRYSPAAARICVRVSVYGERIMLQVKDDGPGLGDTDLARLGERFFRVPGSSASGSGLGWSIVQRIAAVHGFDLKAGRASASGGLVVSLSCNEPGISEAGQITSSGAIQRGQ